MRLTMRDSIARFHNCPTRNTRNVSDRMIQSESWINFSASLHCAGFIKLAGRGLSGVERFIGLSGISLQLNCIPRRNPGEIYNMSINITFTEVAALVMTLLHISLSFDMFVVFVRNIFHI